MRKRTSAIGLAITLGGVLAAATLVAPAAGDEPVVSPPALQYDPAGVLALTTGGEDVVVFDPDADGSPELVQALAEGPKCLLDTDESLLAFDGRVGSDETDAASFASDSLGVAEKKSGVSCSQVGEPGERLILSLNPANVRGQLGELMATSGYLDVELKKDARILAIASLDGAETGRFELQSGGSIGSAALAEVDDVFVCNNPADSGPDSTVNDNCRWPISVPSWLGADDGIAFDTLQMRAVTGDFSLEGGSDGTVPDTDGIRPPLPYAGASLFELAQPKMGDLACGDSTGIEAVGTSPGVTVDRLEANADPEESCVKVPYTLGNGTTAGGIDYAQFLKPLDQQSTAQFVITLTWTAKAGDPLPLSPTFADYETPVRGDEIQLGWCPDPLHSAGGDLIGIVDPLTNPDVVDQDESPGIQFTCIGDQRSVVVPGSAPGLADDIVRVTEQLYVLGDIYLRR